MVPFLNLGQATAELRGELDSVYHRFMDSGWYVLGEEVEAFETEYAAYCESQYCVGVGSGLDALILALKALDVGPGDEVLVPSNTYIATWLAITHVGASIVPVEPNRLTHNIDVSKLQNAITHRSKVILPVNLYGQPVEYQPILDIASKASLKVVVDNAQAHGARYQGHRVGGVADIECHSFYPSKNLGAFGEAGAVTTNSGDIADRVRVLRNYGSRIRYQNEVCGTNSRLDALQAAFLRVKLRHLDVWNDRRRQCADLYRKHLSCVSDINLPYVIHDADPVWHLFVVRHPQRDALQRHLTEKGIGTQIHYPTPPHRSGAYNSQYVGKSRLPIAEQLADTVLSLPMGPHLTKDSVLEVAAEISNFAASRV